MGKKRIEELLNEAESLATDAVEYADDAKSKAKAAILKMVDVRNELWLIVDKSDTIAEKVSEVLFDKWGTVMEGLSKFRLFFERHPELLELRTDIMAFHKQFYEELGENGNPD